MNKTLGIGIVLLAPVAGFMCLVLFIMMTLSGGSLGEKPSDESTGGRSAVIGTCSPACPGQDGPQTTMSVKAALTQALSEVGTSRPTGWDMPGECIKSAQRWVTAGGGRYLSGGVVSGPQNSPALRVTDGSLRPGDVVQYTNPRNPEAFAFGVHTFMIVAVHGDGTFDLVESNNPGGSGLVGIRKNTRAPAPAGWESWVWRFAAQPDI